MKTLNKDLSAIQLSQVIEQLKEMSDSDLQVCHNNYCIELCYEDEIYDNDEYNINEHFNTPFDALLAIEHYNLSDDYFYFHNGNLISFNYLTSEDSPIDISELAQWLISEDKLADYDIEVTTLDDMLASIEDNITDDSELLKTAINYLGVSTMINGDDKVTDYNQYLIDSVIDEIRYTDYETIKDVINRLGINYQ